MFDHRNVEKSRTLSHLKALDGTAGTPPGQPQLHEDASRTQGGGDRVGHGDGSDS